MQRLGLSGYLILALDLDLQKLVFWRLVLLELELQLLDKLLALLKVLEVERKVLEVERNVLLDLDDLNPLRGLGVLVEILRDRILGVLVEPGDNLLAVQIQIQEEVE